MLDPQLMLTNPLTGGRVWLLRHVPSEVKGGKVDWVVTVKRDHYFSDTAKMYGLCGQGMGRKGLEDLRTYLRRVMRFKHIKAQRNGAWREY